MIFAAPLLLALGVLALPLVALYILKVRRRPVVVPYLRLWESLVVESRARSLFERLRRLLSLLLQLAILALLVGALGDPSLEIASVEKESIVVLIDASASMQTREASGETRFELALRSAADLVEERSFEDEMMLLAVSDKIEVLSNFSRSRLRLREALETASVTHRGMDAPRALAFAREVTQGKEHPRVWILTDGAAGDFNKAAGELAKEIRSDEEARILPIGAERENVGILGFRARKNTSLGTDYVFARVKNFGEAPRALRLELSVDGVTKKVLERTLGSGEERVEDFELALPEGGALRLALTPGDAFAVDDEAWAIARPARLRKVVLVSETVEEALPYWIALESMGEVVAAESFAASATDYAALSEDERVADVTIAVGILPVELPEQGDLILLDTDFPAFLPGQAGEPDPSPAVWDWDRDHVLNRFLNWRGLPIPPARGHSATGGVALVSGYGGALVSAYDLTSRRVVYVGFDMSAELFPLRLAFPLLLRNAIAWFEVEEDELFEDVYAPGATIRPLRRVAVPSVRAAWFRAGLPVEEDLEVVDGRFLFDETEKPGTFLFRVGGANHAVAVSPCDPGESAIAPLEESESAGLAASPGHWLNRELWWWLALAGLLVWALEWALYHRRLTE